MKESLEYIISIIIYFLFSAIIALIYICYFIDRKRVNKCPLVICYILLLFFIFLNFISAFDLMKEEMDNSDKITKIINTKVIAYFYTCFHVINIGIRFVIFPIYINYLETGYYTKKTKIFFEPIIRIFKKLFCKSNCVKALIIIGLIMAFIIVILYFIVRDKFGLDSPFSYVNYIFILLDLYSLFQIYINVGFFLVQSVIDCKRQNDQRLVKKYYYYSKSKVILKSLKYVKNIFNAKVELEKTIAKFQGMNWTPYCFFISKLLNLSQENIQLYHMENIIKENNQNNKINPTINNNNINLNFSHASNNANSINIIIKNCLDSAKDQVIKNLDSKDKEIESIKPEKKISNKKNENEIQKEDSLYKAVEDRIKKLENEAENDLAEPIRSFKNGQRKLRRMKKRYKDLDEEKDLDLNKEDKLHKIWIFCKYFFLFIAFIYAICSDFVVPLANYSNLSLPPNITNITNDSDLYFTDINSDISDLTDLNEINSNNNTNETIIEKKDKSTFEEILQYLWNIISTCACVIFVSSYTIIIIFSISRRYYISGDYLYGRNMNDTISLIKTLKIICGFAFPLVFCNLYIFNNLYTEEGKLKYELIFYEKFQIPDYEIKYGITVYMIAKIVIIVFSIIIFKCTNKLTFLFKNDLGEFNRNYKDKDYNENIEEECFNREIKGKELDKFLIE